VEVLIALAVIGLTAVSIIGAFATTISATATHRSFATADTVLRSFVESATYQIKLQQNPLFVPCPQSSNVYNSIAASYQATNNFSVSLSVTTMEPCTPSTTNPPPQLITASVAGPHCSGKPQCDATASLTFVVTNPANTNGVVASPPVIDSITPNTGPATGLQSAVTIAGSGFGGATSVMFGSTTCTTTSIVCTINSVSANSISVTPPVDTGAVESVIVTVTTPNGSSSPNAASVYYYGPAVTNVSPNVGTSLGGTYVTITGNSFSLVSQVNFGSTPATSFIINSPNSITAVSPGQGASPTTVDITVVTPFGTSSINPPGDQFSYGLSVVSVSPSSGPGSGGTPVTILGNGFLGAFAVDFGSTVVPITPSTSDNVITVNSPAGSGSVDVTVVTTSGTSPTSPLDKFTYNPGPVVGLGIQSPTSTAGFSCGTPSANDNCTISGISNNNGTATFYVDFVDVSGDPVIYSSTSASVVSVAGGSVPNVTIPLNESTSTGTVTVRLNGSNSSVCTLTFGSFTLTVTVTT
jgi:hypothetical protein